MQKFIYLIILSFLSKSAICQSLECYYPLEVGNKWEYSCNDHLIFYWSTKVEIISKEIMDNNKHYYTRREITISERKDTVIRYLRLDDTNNVYEYNKKLKKEFLYLRLDLIKGDTAIIPSQVGSFPILQACKYTGLSQDGKKIKSFCFGNRTPSGYMGCWASETYQKDIGMISGNYEINVDVSLTKCTIMPNSIKEQKSSISSYKLLNNYPNPFNPSTSIRCILSNQSTIALKIYNTNGQLIKILHNGNLDAGEHTFIWNGKNEINSSVSSGIYYYTLNIYNNRNMVYSETKRMILIK